MNYRKERIVIIGLGLTGLSCVNFFLSKGVVPLVMDIQFVPKYLQYLPKYIKCSLGELNEKWILSATLIVISPGVPLSHPYLMEALRVGIEIIGDIELFVREIDNPIIAITGSNGKSTVTTLIYQMAVLSGLRVGLGGNIGLPALMLLNKSYQLYILELSSFQLETTYNLCATVATVLNISYDHMDRYCYGLSQYRAAKLRIYKNAKICLINSADPLTYPICMTHHTRYISFGSYELGADYYLDWYHGQYCLMLNNMPVLRCSEMKISGYHNYMNALAALALADIMMIPREYSLLVLQQFSGLSHCLELVFENNGIRWINDSKATNVNSTIAAINNLLTSNGMLHLLLGGDGKCANFFPLANWVQKDNVRIYCFGKDKENLAHLKSCDSFIIDNIEQAMHIIANRVKKNDTVLLSPACSSLDQFENFKIRGYVFSYLAKKLGRMSN